MLSKVLRSGDSGARTARKSIRPKSVTYVAGTMCYLCSRAGPSYFGGREGIRTPDPLLAKQAEI